MAHYYYCHCLHVADAEVEADVEEEEAVEDVVEHLEPRLGALRQVRVEAHL